MSKEKKVELKLTTRGALSFEEKTGKDVVEVLKEISDTETLKVSIVLALYECMGEGNDVDSFDAWDAPFTDKAAAVMQACSAYMKGKSSKK